MTRIDVKEEDVEIFSGPVHLVDLQDPTCIMMALGTLFTMGDPVKIAVLHQKSLLEALLVDRVP